jgi:hypothetical protein
MFIIINKSFIKTSGSSIMFYNHNMLEFMYGNDYLYLLSGKPVIARTSWRLHLR